MNDLFEYFYGKEEHIFWKFEQKNFNINQNFVLKKKHFSKCV